MRISRVELQGFKTFAQKTVFAFDPGVTAIVGPNGSGKSNVVDAVRWCLGEQSFGLLRSRKTADVIFSGSDKKARLGMATVSLTLDNEAGELPVDFDEVKITRRAYRDGDNEYLLNGQKVRLQDISQLLTPSGLGRRTYAVIGQGLIDQVLSLKPDERRALLEEAAGIAGFQAKRGTALRRLDATAQNLSRVRDIVAEISPRLSHLRRQAERARERAQIEADLHGLLRHWYGYRWHAALQELAEQRGYEQELRRVVEARRQGLQEIGERIAGMRRQQGSLRDHLSQLHAESSAQHHQAERVGRDLAVAQERSRQLQSRQEETQRELAELRLQQAALAQRQSDLHSHVESAQAQLGQRQEAVEHVQQELSQRQQGRQDLLEQLENAQEHHAHVRNNAADRRTRLAQLAEQRSARQSSQAAQLAARREQETEAHLLSEQVVEAEQAAAQATDRMEALEATIAHHQANLGSLRQDLERHAELRRSAERAVDRLQTRYDLLDRLHNEGAGYASGVRAVIQANSRGQLTGILGTVASLLQVPPELDKAIETALGGAFQNVITTRWADTHAAIEYLKQNREGRATFLPLDRLHPSRPIPAPQAEGILGNAVVLVEYDAQIEVAVQQLLNRVWVTARLEIARGALDRLRGSRPTVVTLDGEIVRPGGSVTGGTDRGRSDDSVLAREREYRQLPAQLDQANRQVDSATSACALVSQRLESLQAELEELQQIFSERSRDVRLSQQRLSELRHRRDQARQAVAWRDQLLEQIEVELGRLDHQEAALQEELATLSEEEVQARMQVDAAEADVADNSVDLLLQQLADLRAAAAETQGHLHSQQALLDNLNRSRHQVVEQIAAKESKLAQLVHEFTELASQIAKHSQLENSLSLRIGELQERIDPLEDKLEILAEEQNAAEAQERHVQQLLRRDENNWNAAQLRLQRAEDRLEALRHEIRHDFGLAEMEESEDTVYQPPLPIDTLVQQLPIVQELPPGLDSDVKELRAHLRRLGNVNPDAPREYDEVSERHAFLVSQSEDLEKAAADLHSVIRELDRRMEVALLETFHAVAREFVHFFQILFSGGTAKLILTEPEDIVNTGIDIIARPPGKRPQSLALLSGGERSLTACALIFSILRVSPTPFCILDEVDAALDESNVDRFRDALQGLQDQTQFIIITHNRRTLEAANTIYGITMGDDGISHVLSLRLRGDDIERNDNGGEKAAETTVAM